ncbi:MAG TPA: DNA polymerase III subunit gamma and tau [Aeromicrobium sp.]|nr:DNA polymerase III subunit gamma and tau [Aeromicrobium sp.]
MDEARVPPTPTEAPLALYRRYRPETFAEVIGQDHVAEPLRHALAGNRVHHAYLFSGPRGCGKTTSARILARALNCEKAPVADPCGECQSCRDLARGGPGSIDVIEIDAATHGNVDEARDLRERAFFSPVSSRYKVYIIDEAHMVSTAAFNALLKLVEEPPPHVRFIFATTEPDKVIGTIRSRTHHYPFRLVPPKALGDYLVALCEQEGVKLEPTALPLVVRAGAGSVRDTLSVLDQLLGGAGPEGVTYDLAVQLLGYTPDSLLDESIDAFAAHDGSTVFRVVDKVIESGQDPRRFAEDLLQRLRDLVIVKAVPDALTTGLLDAPPDRAERLQQQASLFGGSELTRAADIVNEALVDFRGATAPRLLLELMSARILVPTADQSDHGLAARLDRLERRIGIEGGAPPAMPPAPAPTPAPTVTQSPAEPLASVSDDVPDEPEEPEEVVATPALEPEPAPAAGNLGIADVRRLWPGVLDRVKEIRRLPWVVLSQNAQLLALDGDTLTIGLVNTGARDSFVSTGSVDVLRQALQDVLGVAWNVDAIVDPTASPGADSASATEVAPSPKRGTSAPESVRRAAKDGPPAKLDDPDAAAHPDDPVIDSSLDPEQLLAVELGAKVIDEPS